MLSLIAAAALASVPVVVVNRDILPCQAVKVADLRVVRLPEAFVPETSFRTAQEAVDWAFVAGETVLAGEILRRERSLPAHEAMRCLPISGRRGEAYRTLRLPAPTAAIAPGAFLSLYAPAIGCVWEAPIAALTTPVLPPDPDKGPTDGAAIPWTSGPGGVAAGAWVSTFSESGAQAVSHPEQFVFMLLPIRNLGLRDPPLCGSKLPIPAGPWTLVVAPESRIRGGTPTAPWVGPTPGALSVPAGEVGLISASGGLIRPTWSWMIEGDWISGDAAVPVQIAPGGAAVVSLADDVPALAWLAGIRDAEVAEIALRADGELVVAGAALGETEALLVDMERSARVLVRVSGEAVKPKKIGDTWKNVTQGSAAFASTLEGGPFEAREADGWVEARALAPGRAIVSWTAPGGKKQAIVVESR